VRVCAGKQAVLRVSLASTCWFALHLLACLLMRSAEDPRVPLHGGWFGWKLLFWLGGLIGAPSGVAAVQCGITEAGCCMGHAMPH
jgi:hypothetical protein